MTIFFEPAGACDGDFHAAAPPLAGARCRERKWGAEVGGERKWVSLLPASPRCPSPLTFVYFCFWLAHSTL